MQENMKLITGKISLNEFDAFSRLAKVKRGSISAMLRKLIQDFIQRNMSTVIHLRLFSKRPLRFRDNDNDYVEFYPKIRQAIELIRETQNNALEIALNEEKGINNQKEF